jgi:hypothetical protein
MALRKYTGTTLIILFDGFTVEICEHAHIISGMFACPAISPCNASGNNKFLEINGN